MADAHSLFYSLNQLLEQNDDQAALPCALSLLSAQKEEAGGALSVPQIETLRQIAHILYRLGRREECLKTLNEILEGIPRIQNGDLLYMMHVLDYAGASCLRGELLEEMGNLAEAEASFQAGIDYFRKAELSNYLEPSLKLANFHSRHRRFEQAFALFTQMSEVEFAQKKDPPAYAYYCARAAEAQWQLGKKDEAVARFENVLKFLDGWKCQDTAEYAMIGVIFAGICHEGGNADRALALLQAVRPAVLKHLPADHSLRTKALALLGELTGPH